MRQGPLGAKRPNGVQGKPVLFGRIGTVGRNCRLARGEGGQKVRPRGTCLTASRAAAFQRADRPEGGVASAPDCNPRKRRARSKRHARCRGASLSADRRPYSVSRTLLQFSSARLLIAQPTCRVVRPSKALALPSPAYGRIPAARAPSPKSRVSYPLSVPTVGRARTPAIPCNRHNAPHFRRGHSD